MKSLKTFNYNKTSQKILTTIKNLEKKLTKRKIFKKISEKLLELIKKLHFSGKNIFCIYPEKNLMHLYGKKKRLSIFRIINI